jgi:putative membrane protein (TIGR04086 family)
MLLPEAFSSTRLRSRDRRGSLFGQCSFAEGVCEISGELLVEPIILPVHGDYKMKTIRWGWVLLGGFLAELAIFVVVIPLSLLVGQPSLNYSAPVASFVASFLFGAWVARKAQQQLVLHGALVGIVATLLYVGISLGQPEPIAYVIAHALKVLGGVAGGFVAWKRAAANAVSRAQPA